MNEHPTQALLDMLTMRGRFGSLKGLRVAVIGDVMHSRVARSNIIGLTTMGASVVLCAPPTLMPVGIEKMGCTVAKTVQECVSGADVVMGLRIQRERQQAGLFPSVAEYCDNWEITPELMLSANNGAILMHPGPINRGVEVSSDAADSDASVIDAQVTNGVAVRMALLYMLTRRELTPFKDAGGAGI
jgi:aspartate carbamoyltransferase catalytic subunit